jgi:hypothetical protein
MISALQQPPEIFTADEIRHVEVSAEIGALDVDMIIVPHDITGTPRAHRWFESLIQSDQSLAYEMFYPISGGALATESMLLYHGKILHNSLNHVSEFLFSSGYGHVRGL